MIWYTHLREAVLSFGPTYLKILQTTVVSEAAISAAAAIFKVGGCTLQFNKPLALICVSLHFKS